MRSRGNVMINAPMTAAMAPLAPRQGTLEKGAPGLGRHGDYSADEVEECRMAAPWRLQWRTEGPQIHHVADDVHPAGMHKHGAQQG